jgi:hypothetical protein
MPVAGAFEPGETKMPYTVPTVDQFQTRFPIFADADTELVQMILDEAAGSVDKSWIERDYQPAIMYLAAHLLATDNSEEGDSVNIGGANAGAIASETFGAISVSYQNSASNVAGSSSLTDLYGGTVYGRRFLALLRRNKPAIVVV